MVVYYMHAIPALIRVHHLCDGNGESSSFARSNCNMSVIRGSTDDMYMGKHADLIVCPLRHFPSSTESLSSITGV